jgi:hypothetical protein
MTCESHMSLRWGWGRRSDSSSWGSANLELKTVEWILYMSINMYHIFVKIQRIFTFFEKIVSAEVEKDANFKSKTHL